MLFAEGFGVRRIRQIFRQFVATEQKAASFSKHFPTISKHPSPQIIGSFIVVVSVEVFNYGNTPEDQQGGNFAIHFLQAQVIRGLEDFNLKSFYVVFKGNQYIIMYVGCPLLNKASGRKSN